MTVTSLRFRLLSIATLSTLVALLLAGVSLVTLFERHLERRFDEELELHLTQLIGHIEMDQQGRIHVNGSLADPRFEQPLGGLYWQVQDDQRPTLLRSRSLWDTSIDLPLDQLSTGEVHSHRLPGPAGQILMVRERQVILLPESESRMLRVVVARDHNDLLMARQSFASDLLPYFTLLLLFLLLANLFQVHTGLAPMELVRQGVMSVRSGTAKRIDSSYPDEVMPLVDAINSLLQTRDNMVERARSWTADLAHGLKTPLSALGADAQKLRELGQPDIADDLDDLAQFMRRRVDRELIRARLRSSDIGPVARTELLPVLDRVLRTLMRTVEGEQLVWDTVSSENVRIAMREDDIIELLGNLLDNAAKWAKSRVRVSVRSGNSIQLLIEDDGPGVPNQQLHCLIERGVRLDEKVHGDGLGLAIVQDIIDAYHASIEFKLSPLGGLAVSVLLPAADTQGPDKWPSIDRADG